MKCMHMISRDGDHSEGWASDGVYLQWRLLTSCRNHGQRKPGHNILNKNLLLGLDVGSANDDNNFFRWIQRFVMNGSVIYSLSFLLDGCRQTCQPQLCCPRPTRTTEGTKCLNDPKISNNNFPVPNSWQQGLR